MRISKALSHLGLTSRRKAPLFLKENFVSHQDKRIHDLDYQINLNQEPILYVNRKKYTLSQNIEIILLHKPKGYICSHRRYKNENIIKDLLPKNCQHFFYAGRLDSDSTGLILLSNNGDVIQKLSHPSFEVPKKYIVEIDKKLTSANMYSCTQGIIDEEEHLIFDKIKPTTSRNVYMVTLHQGRKHEIKRVFNYFNYEVLSLKRIQLGKYKLEGIEEGSFEKIVYKNNLVN